MAMIRSIGSPSDDHPSPAWRFAPGSTLYVRWYDYNDDATLDQVAIDDGS